MTEQWKSVEGYEDLYEVSNLGRIRSLPQKGKGRRNKVIIRRPSIRSGYQVMCLSKNGKQKTHSVHRLVAAAFVNNPYGYSEINHKDEDKTNNIASNLEWCDRKYNVNYGHRTEKTSFPVSMWTASGLYIRSFKSIREAARYINKPCPGNISNVLLGYANTAYGYRWKKEI